MPMRERKPRKNQPRASSHGHFLGMPPTALSSIRYPSLVVLNPVQRTGAPRMVQLPDRFSENGKNGEKRLINGRKTVNKRIKNRRKPLASAPPW